MTAATNTGFAIGVRYLTGYAVAALPTGAAEWPPHPARLFMALAAAYHQTSGDAEELAALAWLEKQAPPEVIASASDDRRAVTVYVPPNDFTAKDTNILPQWRNKRQPRKFPRVRPHSDTVHFVWPTEPDSQHAEALQRLCGKVARLGHSSSLVHVWMQTDPVEQDQRHHYRPAEHGRLRLRRVNPGTLEYLSDIYREADIEEHFRLDAQVLSTRTKAKKQPLLSAYEERFGHAWVKNTPPERQRPQMSAAVAYEQVGSRPSPSGSCFDPDLIVLELSPKSSRFRRLAAATSPKVCDVLRRALMKHAPDGFEVVSGHYADGSPLREAHLALIPLPHVGGRHGDGHLMGAAAALPKDIERADRDELMRALQKVANQCLTLGDLGEWQVSLVSLDERRTLQPTTWTVASHGSGGAKYWATVTPIALDRHPKAKDAIEQQDELAAMIRRSCLAIRLPEPVRAVPLPVSVFSGVPDAGRYPRLARKDGSKRRQTHALLSFDEPVVGPVLLGAGRFRGWGLCRPYVGGAT